MYMIELLVACSDLEAEAGRVYRTFATRFAANKAAARLWRELALEEETHADILGRERKNFEEQDSEGAFLPDFDARVERVRKRLVAISAAADTCTIEQAFAMASELERCGIEELYDDLTVKSDPAFKLLEERLEAALSNLPEHQERVARAASRHRSS